MRAAIFLIVTSFTGTIDDAGGAISLLQSKGGFIKIGTVESFVMRATILAAGLSLAHGLDNGERAFTPRLRSLCAMPCVGTPLTHLSVLAPQAAA